MLEEIVGFLAVITGVCTIMFIVFSDYEFNEKKEIATTGFWMCVGLLILGAIIRSWT